MTHDHAIGESNDGHPDEIPAAQGLPADPGCPDSSADEPSRTLDELVAGLYVVATPIGHLADLSPRAVHVLRHADFIAAEDTRTSRPLLDRIGSRVRTVALHAHNEASAGAHLVERMVAGARIALITDAGTPAISDPGARVVAAAHRAGVRVIPVPGPSAITALASVAGLGHTRFRFEGFIAASGRERTRALDRLIGAREDVIAYESPHRIARLAADLLAALGAQREVVIGRELTKKFEEVARMRLGDLPAWLDGHGHRQRGEFALVILAPEPDTGAGNESMIEGATDGVGESHEVSDAVQLDDDGVSELGRHAMHVLAGTMPPRQAAKLAARISGDRANDLYRVAMLTSSKR